MGREGFLMVKPAANGGWILESNIFVGRCGMTCSRTIAVTSDQLVNGVLEFAALTEGGGQSLAEAVEEMEREVVNGT